MFADTSWLVQMKTHFDFVGTTYLRCAGMHLHPDLNFCVRVCALCKEIQQVVRPRTKQVSRGGSLFVGKTDGNTATITTDNNSPETPAATSNESSFSLVSTGPHGRSLARSLARCLTSTTAPFPPTARPSVSTTVLPRSAGAGQRRPGATLLDRYTGPPAAAAVPPPLPPPSWTPPPPAPPPPIALLPLTPPERRLPPAHACSSSSWKEDE